jgi:hypothetical protein
MPLSLSVSCHFGFLVSCHSDFLCLMSFWLSLPFTHCLCSRHRLLSVGTGIDSVLKCTAEVPIRLQREMGMFVTRRTIGVGCEPARLGVILWLLHLRAGLRPPRWPARAAGGLGGPAGLGGWPSSVVEGRSFSCLLHRGAPLSASHVWGCRASQPSRCSG